MINRGNLGKKKLSKYKLSIIKLCVFSTTTTTKGQRNRKCNPQFQEGKLDNGEKTQ